MWLDLPSTFVLTPFLIFTEEDPDFVPEALSRGFVLHPTLPVDRVTLRKFRMAQDSDDPLFVVNIVVWVLVVILAIVALNCPLPRRVVR